MKELIIIDNLLMPIRAIHLKVEEIRKEMLSVNSPLIITSMFLMLVSYLESMQKEVLRYYLKYDPKMITTKKMIEIDIDTLIDNEDFNLMDCLVSDCIEKMSYRDIAKLFFKVLDIKEPDNDIKSIKKRRNELIHKNLKMDFKQAKAEHDYINSEYLSLSMDEYVKYLNCIQIQICDKYGKYTKLNALKNLWNYTFNTPLCNNFEDYWYIERDSDSISGWKTCQYEKSLSHSETFMLSIWRSQVSGYKVDFINMSSLGHHMQICLYMFLKLSNDIFLY